MHGALRLLGIGSTVAVYALLFLYSIAAQAQEPGTGLFIPDPPVAGNSINYRFNFPFGCPLIPFPNVDGESEWVLVDGNDVHLFVVFNQGSFCGVPPDGPVIDFDLGTLPMGQYTLLSYRVPTSVTFPANPADFDPVSETVFGVVAGPASVPSLSAVGLGMLMMLLMGVAVRRLMVAQSTGHTQSDTQTIEPIS